MYLKQNKNIVLNPDKKLLYQAQNKIIKLDAKKQLYHFHYCTVFVFVIFVVITSQLYSSECVKNTKKNSCKSVCEK